MHGELSLMPASDAHRGPNSPTTARLTDMRVDVEYRI